MRSCRVTVLLPFVMRGSTPLEVPLICLLRAVEAVYGVPPMMETLQAKLSRELPARKAK